DVLGDVSGRPAAAEQRAGARFPHAMNADEVDARHGRDAAALVRGPVLGQDARHPDPREVLAVAGRPDHRADPLGAEVDRLRSARHLSLAPVALELRFRDVFAAATREIADAADELPRDVIARAQERFEVGSEGDARAGDTCDAPGQPGSSPPDGADIEVLPAPAREERERVVRLGTVRVAHDAPEVAVVAAPDHLVTTVDAPRDPAVATYGDRNRPARTRQLIGDLESRLARADHQYA